MNLILFNLMTTVIFSFVLFVIYALLNKLKIKWINKPNSIAPVQAEGFFLGHYFYFRSRYDQAKIQFSKSQHDWDIDNITKTYVLYTTKETYGASWIPKWFAYVLIYKGCIKFLLKLKSNNGNNN